MFCLGLTLDVGDPNVSHRCSESPAKLAPVIDHKLPRPNSRGIHRVFHELREQGAHTFLSPLVGSQEGGPWLNR